ncbi:unnamed protein product [Owenia fusiformis]|uniref:Uncharacterized protein n=1 Tax=Owenia fusiformis TaxID=6347 RepID=A0A8J1UF30_OWEFU|nr:unnamed protein product [Owenia fusiformis]
MAWPEEWNKPPLNGQDNFFTRDSLNKSLLSISFKDSLIAKHEEVLNQNDQTRNSKDKNLHRTASKSWATTTQTKTKQQALRTLTGEVKKTDVINELTGDGFQSEVFPSVEIGSELEGTSGEKSSVTMPTTDQSVSVTSQQMPLSMTKGQQSQESKTIGNKAPASKPTVHQASTHPVSMTTAQQLKTPGQQHQQLAPKFPHVEKMTHTVFKSLYQPYVPYPRKSSLTKEEQKIYIELYNTFLTYLPQKPSPQEIVQINKFRELQMKVGPEQEEFLRYSEKNAMAAEKDYTSMAPGIHTYMQEYVEHQRGRVLGYGKYFTVKETIPIVPTSKAKAEVTFQHTKTLLSVGHSAKAILPNMSDVVKPKCSTDYSKVNKRFPARMPSNSNVKQPCSKDPNIKQLLAQYNTDIVVSSSGLKCLLDNNAPQFSRQWMLPLLVKEYTTKVNGKSVQKKVVIIDKPFLSKTPSHREKMTKFNKLAMRVLITHPHHSSSKVHQRFGAKPRDINEDIDKPFKPEPKAKVEVEEDLFDSFSTEIEDLETFGTDLKSKPDHGDIKIQQMAPNEQRKGSESEEAIEKGQTIDQAIDKGQAIERMKWKIKLIDKTPEMTERAENIKSRIKTSELEVPVDPRLLAQRQLVKFSDAPSSPPSSEKSGKDTYTVIVGKPAVLPPEIPDLPSKSELPSPASPDKSEKTVTIPTKSKSKDANLTQEEVLSKLKVTRKRGRPKKQAVGVNVSRSSDDEMLIIDSNEESIVTSPKVAKVLESPGRVTRGRAKGQMEDIKSKSPKRRSSSNTSEKQQSVSKQHLKEQQEVDVTTEAEEPYVKTLRRTRSTMRQPGQATDVASEHNNVAQQQDSNRKANMKSKPKPSEINQDSNIKEDKMQMKKVKQIKKDIKNEPATGSVSSMMDQIMLDQEKMYKLGANKAAKGVKQDTDTSGQGAKQKIHDPITIETCESAENYHSVADNQLTYSLWKLGDLSMMVRCALHGLIRQYRKEPYYVQLSAKMEYQTIFGGEQCTASEISRDWIKTKIREQFAARLIRGRINNTTNEIVILDEIEHKDIIYPRCPFNPSLGVESLQGILSKLSKLPVGEYLLSHEAGEPHCSVSSSTEQKSGTFDLRHCYQGYTDKVVPILRQWIPVDPNTFLPWQKKYNRIPATFEPRENPQGPTPTNLNKSKAKKNRKRARKGKGQAQLQTK